MSRSIEWKHEPATHFAYPLPRSKNGKTDDLCDSSLILSYTKNTGSVDEFSGLGNVPSVMTMPHAVASALNYFETGDWQWR